MNVNARKRNKIVTLSKHIKTAIAKLVGVNRGTMSRIVKKAAETGSLTFKRKGNCGQKQKATLKDDSFILHQSKNDPKKTSDALKINLALAGVEVSSSSVHRRLLENDRSSRRSSC